MRCKFAILKTQIMNKLFKCPYNIEFNCSLTEPCINCKQFVDYTKRQTCDHDLSYRYWMKNGSKCLKCGVLLLEKQIMDIKERND